MTNDGLLDLEDMDDGDNDSSDDAGCVLMMG